jgi:hypothetical protein
MFLNEVANGIHNRFKPNMKIGTYVYFFTVPTPKIPVTSYLRPYVCDYVRKDNKVPLFAPMNAHWWRSLNEWTAICDRVVLREYWGIYVYLRPLAEVAAWDIKFLEDIGVRQYTAEGLPSGTTEEYSNLDKQYDFSFMEYWVIARLYWDSNADVEQLRKYFIRRTFRKAAPDMERFFGTIRELYYKEKRTSDFEENQETLVYAYKKRKIKELKNYLRSALAKVEHPVSTSLLKRLALRFNEWCEVIERKKRSE